MHRAPHRPPPAAPPAACQASPHTWCIASRQSAGAHGPPRAVTGAPMRCEPAQPPTRSLLRLARLACLRPCVRAWWRARRRPPRRPWGLHSPTQAQPRASRWYQADAGGSLARWPRVHRAAPANSCPAAHRPRPHRRCGRHRAARRAPAMRRAYPRQTGTPHPM